MIKIGILGGTGYTGVELLRLLAQHPQAKLAVITSRGEAGARAGRPLAVSASISLMNEPLLLWTRPPQGGYLARTLGEGIYTE